MAKQQHSYQKIAVKVREKRESHKRSTAKIAQTMKVPEATVQALEDPSTSEIPHANMYGLYMRYANSLGLDSTEIEAMLHEATPEDQRIKIAKKKPIKHHSSVAVSRLGRLFVLTSVVLLVGGYALLQVLGFNSAPALEVDGEAETITVNSHSYTIEGRAERDATVFFEGESVALDDNERFSKTVFLQPGFNSVEISAVDGFSKQTTKTLHIVYNETEDVEELEQP